MDKPSKNTMFQINIPKNTNRYKEYILLPLLSKRLILRPPTISDLNSFHRCFEDEDAMKHYIDGFSATISETEKKLIYSLNHWEKHQCGDWVVFEKNTQEFMGFCGFDCEIDPGKPNLGYVFL